MPDSVIRLGLFGKGIGKSSAPFLHLTAAKQLNLDLSYELFDLSQKPDDAFFSEFERRKLEGLRGVNVTHPFKEKVFGLVEVSEPMMRRVGAVNTVRFEGNQGFNTDYSGFIKAFKHVLPNENPGSVLIIGAGGAGRAVAFALAELGATQVNFADLDLSRASQLSLSINNAGVKSRVYGLNDLPKACKVDGLVNCTPVGMYQYPGIPLESQLIGGQSWAFDAIYTPLETEFLVAVRSKGLKVISGFELFFYQGVDAFKIFTGFDANEDALRQVIRQKLGLD
jgi:shikimate dehydrogenase